jgi:hypothetical protein
MIPYEVDPSLHSEEPHAQTLDDGFSRPDIATHPVVPEPATQDPDPVAPNTSHLPVEPEFPPPMPPAEADDPHPSHPKT